MFTVNSSGDPPGAREGRAESPVRLTVTPLLLALGARASGSEVGTTVAAEVAAGLLLVAVAPWAAVPAEDPDPPEHPASTIVAAQARPKAAPQADKTPESLPCRTAASAASASKRYSQDLVPLRHAANP
jgi:hypothetical protein